jgi:hypothetical protein
VRRFLERIVDWFVEAPGDGTEVFEERLPGTPLVDDDLDEELRRLAADERFRRFMEGSD